MFDHDLKLFAHILDCLQCMARLWRFLNSCLLRVFQNQNSFYTGGIGRQALRVLEINIKITFQAATSALWLVVSDK